MNAAGRARACFWLWAAPLGVLLMGWVPASPAEAAPPQAPSHASQQPGQQPDQQTVQQAGQQPGQQAGGPAGRPTGTVPQTSATPEDSLLKAFTDSLAAWKVFPESVRVARARVMFRPYGLDDICRVCRQATQGGPGADRRATMFLQAKIFGSPLPSRDIGRLMVDPTLGLPCEKVLLNYIGRSEPKYRQSERDSLSTVLLQLADTPGYDDHMRDQLEVAAASLGQTDEVIQRMQAYGATSSDMLLAHAVRMMSVSHDPRSIGLLSDLIESRARNGQMIDGKTLLAAARKLKEKAADHILDFLPLAQSPEDHRSVIEAAANTENPKVIPLLLHEYGDSLSGIRDRTDAINTVEDKERYYWLWSCTRSLEPQLTADLNGSSHAARLNAVELLDRSSRFGGLLDYDGVRAGLLATAKEEPALRDRITQILLRFDQYKPANPQGGE